MKYLACILVSFLLLLACKKDVPESEITPVIKIQSISTLSVTQFKDSIIILLTYEDSDGDLGRQDPDNNSIWIKDDRVPAGETYHLPPVVSETDNYTKGTIRVFIPSLFLFGNGNQEKTKLTIRIQDQAGHWSDEVVTPIITVNR